jgi:hypothetical protein
VAAQESAVEHNRHDRAPLGIVQIGEVHRPANGSAIDQDVEPAEMRDTCIDQARNIGRVGHIGKASQRSTACRSDLGGNSVGAGTVCTRIDHHGGAAGGQFKRDGAANPPGTPGDQCDPPGQWL